MLLISRTPKRISFFGGGTDYRDFFLRHGGAVLGATLDQYIYISIKTLKSAFFDHNIRIAYAKTELVKEVSEIEHPSIRECLKHRGIAGNLDIHIFSDLPARTGLGSSSSFTVGFLNGLNALEERILSKQQLAEEACHVEQDLIQENVGCQDQFHAVFGGFNIIEFGENTTKVIPLVLEPEKKEILQSHLMVFYTGLTRNASAVLQEQIERTKNRTLDGVLLRMKEMVYEAQEMIAHFSGEKMAEKLGQLLHEGWEAKKKLSSRISNTFIDQVYAAAMQAGAYGGKLCGAGSGGFLAFLVPPEKQVSVRESLSGLKEVDFRFEDHGSSIIYMKD